MGYTTAFPAGSNKRLGYAYPAVDSDGDGLVDGFEHVVGTNILLKDSMAMVRAVAVHRCVAMPTSFRWSDSPSAIHAMAQAAAIARLRISFFRMGLTNVFLTRIQR